MIIAIDMFSSAMKKNGLYKNVLRFKMLPQSKVTRACVVQPQQ